MASVPLADVTPPAPLTDDFVPWATNSLATLSMTSTGTSHAWEYSSMVHALALSFKNR